MAGLVLCGRCGRKMSVRYAKQGRVLRYVCTNRRRQTGQALCQSFGARRLERAIEGLLLEALSPLGMEAMLEGARAHEAAVEERRQRERHRVERARYEVDLSRRQYEAVDPSNRLVAAELERRWERALSELARAENESEERMAALARPLGQQEEAWLQDCAKDLSQLWKADCTRPQDRKRIARALIENVVVSVPEQGRKLRADLHWAGGEVTTLEVRRGRTGEHRYVTEPELIELVASLAAVGAVLAIAAVACGLQGRIVGARGPRLSVAGGKRRGSTKPHSRESHQDRGDGDPLHFRSHVRFLRFLCAAAGLPE